MDYISNHASRRMQNVRSRRSYWIGFMITGASNMAVAALLSDILIAQLRSA